MLGSSFFLLIPGKMQETVPLQLWKMPKHWTWICFFRKRILRCSRFSPLVPQHCWLGKNSPKQSFPAVSQKAYDALASGSSISHFFLFGPQRKERFHIKAGHKDLIVLLRKNIVSMGTAEPYTLVSSVSFWPVKLDIFPPSALENRRKM